MHGVRTDPGADPPGSRLQSDARTGGACHPIRSDYLFSMPLTEVLHLLHELPRADKLRAVQYLATELAQSEGVQPVDLIAEYPVWSPVTTPESAAALTEVLRAVIR